jgi:hypothetical protein
MFYKTTRLVSSNQWRKKREGGKGGRNEKGKGGAGRKRHSRRLRLH